LAIVILDGLNDVAWCSMLSEATIRQQALDKERTDDSGREEAASTAPIGLRQLILTGFAGNHEPL
jgi:hypothetical protein